MRSFRFTSTWEVPAPPERVRDVVVDLEHYPEWWPQVVAVASLGRDDARVLCRSALPYTLDLVLHAVSRELPVVEVQIDGDLRGRARWSLVPGPAGTRMTFTQEVELVGLRLLPTGPLGPLLRWNHERMMRGGLAGLTARLAGTPYS